MSPNIVTQFNPFTNMCHHVTIHRHACFHHGALVIIMNASLTMLPVSILRQWEEGSVLHVPASLIVYVVFESVLKRAL